MVNDTSTAESRKANKHLRKERGQSLIEFALTAPMLIVLLLGLVEMGHAFNSYMTIVAAARDSARLGAQLGITTSNARDTMRNLVVTETERLENAPINVSGVTDTGSTSSSGTSGNNCNTSDPGVCITWGYNTPTVNGPVDKWVDVKVCYNHSMIVGIPGVLKDDINMCSHTKIRIANPQS
jgi:Flp pilus assembly protein TadG